MRGLLIAVYFVANVLTLFAVMISTRQQFCSANHCGEISKAIRKLETKVNDLIALIKDALPSDEPLGTISIIFLGVALNVFIFKEFSTRSHSKTAVSSILQPVPSLLARSSTTKESKDIVRCFNFEFQIARSMFTDHCGRYKESAFAYGLVQSVVILSFSVRSRRSQVYSLMIGSQKIPVYCHMGNFRCGGGGWTLATKIDGTKVKSLPPLRNFYCF